MGESRNSVFINIPSLSEYVGVVRLAVSGVATRMNFSIEEIEDIKIAVSEACTNAVQYAYEDPSQGKIDVTCNIYEDKLEIIVEDFGKGFVPENKKKAVISENKLGLGLGITFIKSLMDESKIDSVKNQGTRVIMIKKLKNKAE